MFSWGFWGWGTATRQLVAAIDSIEQQRGFQPPIFVDVRFQRSGRAPGFKGDAFEELLGWRRYRWMPTLGNSSIGTGKAARIASPAAAHQLLELAMDNRDKGVRVLFFCACPSPWACDCHRHLITKLLRRAARQRRLSLDVCEWPGGRPTTSVHTLRVSQETLRAIVRGAKAVPLNQRRVPHDFVGAPWGTLLTLKSGRDQFPVAVGPAAYRSGSWVLPRFQQEDTEPARDIHALRRQTSRLRLRLELDA